MPFLNLLWYNLGLQLVSIKLSIIHTLLFFPYCWDDRIFLKYSFNVVVIHRLHWDLRVSTLDTGLLLEKKLRHLRRSYCSGAMCKVKVACSLWIAVMVICIWSGILSGLISYNFRRGRQPRLLEKFWRIRYRIIKLVIRRLDLRKRDYSTLFLQAGRH
jgi:hypothetical protein